MGGGKNIILVVAGVALAFVWYQGNRSTYDVAGAETPLIQAARQGELAGVERALADGADPNQADSIMQRPPLHWATSLESEQSYPGRIRERVAIVEALLRKGADVKRKDASLEGVLYRAVWSPELVEALLKGGAPVEEGVGTRTPLIAVTYYSGNLCDSSVQSMRLLIAAGADVNAQEAGSGWGALLTAALYGCPAMVEVLLQANADPSVKTQFGETVLGALARIEKMEKGPLSWPSTPDPASYPRSKDLIRRAGGN